MKNEVQISARKLVTSGMMNKSWLMSQILEIVLDYRKMPRKLVMSRERKTEYAQPRQEATFFMMQVGMTTSDIKWFYSGFDHTTLLYSEKTVLGRMQVDKDYRADMQPMWQKVNQVIMDAYKELISRDIDVYYKNSELYTAHETDTIHRD